MRVACYWGHAHVVQAFKLLQHPSVAAEAARGTFERHKHSTLRMSTEEIYLGRTQLAFLPPFLEGRGAFVKLSQGCQCDQDLAPSVRIRDLNLRFGLVRGLKFAFCRRYRGASTRDVDASNPFCDTEQRAVGRRQLGRSESRLP